MDIKLIKAAEQFNSFEDSEIYDKLQRAQVGIIDHTGCLSILTIINSLTTLISSTIIYFMDC